MSICVPDENIITSFVEERTHLTISTKIYFSTNIVSTLDLLNLHPKTIEAGKLIMLFDTAIPVSVNIVTYYVTLTSA